MMRSCLGFGVCWLMLAAASPAGELAPEEAADGFVMLFDGKNLEHWQGAVDGYRVTPEGTMLCDPGGNLYTKQQHDNFVLRFEFKLPPGGNNGVGIRTPMGKDAAYHGMEIQILDSPHPAYANLLDTQHHGSIYKVAAAKRGHLKPTGEWNTEEIVADGPHVKVTLNGTVILDADLSELPNPYPDHPGLHNKTGYVGFLGHGSPVEFRNVRIKRLQ